MLLLLLLNLFSAVLSPEIRTGTGGRRDGAGKRLYLSLHCHHQNDSCIKMGSDERHFNVLLIVRDKVTRRCAQTITFLKREESRSVSVCPG